MRYTNKLNPFQHVVKKPKRLETRLIIWVTGLCVLQAVLFGALVYQITAESLHNHMGDKALSLATSIASRDDVLNALQTKQGLNELNKQIEHIRELTAASFIVIGDRNTRRIVHPDSDKLGKPMVGGDSKAALRGERYVSIAKGSLGESIRGKVPVLSEQGEVIGLVSVGFLVQSIEPLIRARSAEIMLWGLLLVGLSILAAVYIGQRVRNAIFGLQPDEIARLFSEQDAILNTVRSGIIALDPEGNVRNLNQRACEILGKPISCIHQPLKLEDLLPEHTEFLMHNQQRPIVGFELFAADKRIVLSRYALQVQGQADGILLSMRPADELEYLSQQLTKVQAFAELLRVQTHDYSNKLNLIGALIQMGQTEQAIELIGQESKGSQAQIHHLLERIQDPVLAGLLVGKYHKARELNVILELNPDSLLGAITRKDMLERVVSILGNLIDNAIEAAIRASDTRTPKVRVTVDETSKTLLFDVEDSGFGLGDDKDVIFTPQYSSKSGAEHGIGLYLVKTNLDSCRGSLEIGESDLMGARLSVYIPK
ncbi:MULTISPECIES: sensor histidine kinase [unclassified Pseudoalteromonas]|uniref:ATP-binding protein n=1 Tax=unclassified Pseudoalteromonas TaxID=194690 RepID=UPI000C8ED5DB|nr:MULTISPECIES: sensor histidine kinase [unclassified Pseudoalteromonas]MAD02295.1 histidine kinase [Pseudoalteromonas sp.]MCG9707530.1 sensor histidine kinase [Pseudoalteromonas sp. Isolate3]MCP4588905.1 sensor histidine kinase [Pseudoalteromonas sp.]QWV04460.1 sensor histidine kinase [Pseudoalteromonas shioyasakiensis]|tara:strand:+ start:30460 stop:32082 length:1623 start_codon:yes stop_codon:yes gene_type:complete